MSSDSLGDRMKEQYERRSVRIRTGRMPLIVRVDGKAFHSYCRGCARPFDFKLIDVMNSVAVSLCEQMQGAQIAFVQSDEISVLLHNYKRHASTAWFDNKQSKIESVTASIAAANMTMLSERLFGSVRPAYFDARSFVMPESEVNNYFVNRQQDWTRNSIAMLAQSMFSARELHGKSCAVMQEMTFQKSGKNWNDLPTFIKRGRCVVRQTYQVDGKPDRTRWVVDPEPPIFSADPSYIEQHLAVEPEAPKPLPRFCDRETAQRVHIIDR